MYILKRYRAKLCKVLSHADVLKSPKIYRTHQNQMRPFFNKQKTKISVFRENKTQASCEQIVLFHVEGQGLFCFDSYTI